MGLGELDLWTQYVVWFNLAATEIIVIVNSYKPFWICWDSSGVFTGIMFPVKMKFRKWIVTIEMKY